MKRREWSVAVLACVLALAPLARGQEEPPPPPRDDAGQQQQPGQPGDRRQMNRRGPGPQDGGPGMGGPNRWGPPAQQPPGNVPPEFMRLRAYLEIVDQFTRMSKDPDAAGVAAVIAVGDMLKPRGHDAVIQYYVQLLPKVGSISVQRAVRIALATEYQATGQNDKAIEQLEALMVAAQAGQATAPAAGTAEKK